MEGQTNIESGKKYDGGKPRLDLISPIAEMELAKVLQYGAQKYGDYNWRGGLKWSRVYAAVRRHLNQWMSGQDIDTESGLPHLAHAMCGIMFLLDYEKTHPELDDRFKLNL